MVEVPEIFLTGGVFSKSQTCRDFPLPQEYQNFAVHSGYCQHLFEFSGHSNASILGVIEKYIQALKTYADMVLQKTFKHRAGVFDCGH